MSGIATLSSSRRELAHRSANGIDVRLFWRPVDNRIIVAVDDALGSAFELDVAPDRALDAFNHPYAYASGAGAAQLLDVAA